MIRRMLSGSAVRKDIAPVLIVGGGPVGSFLSLLLSKHFQVKSKVLESFDNGGDLGNASHPRAHVLHTRSMELLREVGLEEEAWNHVPQPKDWRCFRYCSSLLGEDFAKMDHFNTPEYKLLCKISPCRVAQLSQPLLEQIVLDHAKQEAEAVGSEMIYQHVVKDVFYDAKRDCMVTVAQNTKENREEEFLSDFVVGADGAKSTVRKAMGIELRGERDMETFASIHFTSKALGRALAPKEGGAMLSFVFNSSIICVVVSHDMLKGEWVIHVPFFPPIQNIDAFVNDKQACAKMIRQCVFGPTSSHPVDAGALDDLQVHTVRAWGMHATCAESFSGENNRVFLVGDAAHQFPPSGGFGVNAGLADAHNLAWKLGYVVQNKIDRKILDTYDLERRTTIEDALSIAIDNYRRGMLPAKAMGLDRGAVTTAVSFLSSQNVGGSGSTGKTVRSFLVENMLGIGMKHLNVPLLFRDNVKKIVEKDHLALPLLFPRTDKGYSYPSSSIVMKDDDLSSRRNKKRQHRDFWIRPSVPRNHQIDIPFDLTPGNIVPHCWVKDQGNDSKVISTLDLVSHEIPNFVLLYSDPSWEKVRKSTNLSLVRIHQDALIGTESAKPWDPVIYHGEAVLVRPDGHIAGKFSNTVDYDEKIHDLF